MLLRGITVNIYSNVSWLPADTCCEMDSLILFKIDTSSQNFAPFLFAQAFHQEAGEQEVGSAGNLYMCTVYKITEQLSGGSNT